MSILRTTLHGWQLQTGAVVPKLRLIHTSRVTLSAILYYITGHGFGHAVRSSQVIRRLYEIRPNLKIHVRTTAPKRLFPAAVIGSRQSIDIGVVQADSLHMDLAQTFHDCRRLHENAPRLIEEELAFIRDQHVRLIVGDIPPLCFEIAARAEIPSVGITNFTWDAIYRAYAEQYPDFTSLISEMESFYRKATVGLALPYPCGLEVFPRRVNIPWIARRSNLTRSAARVKFGLPEAVTIVLLSFGGLGLSRLSLSKLGELREFFFVATGDVKKPDENFAVFSDVQPEYEDLVRAVDVIVTKPGYGIVADAIAHRVPVLYTDRGDFAEYPYLVQALTDLATAEFISQDELLLGNLGPHLERLLSKQHNWPETPLDGAAIAAEKIIDLLDDRPIRK
jgi:UDP:flavonoid glycosyltransferase YjiC (YdhE family)